MRIILEIHRYAPELNKAYIGPNKTMIRVPGCHTISDVRKKHFAPLKYKGRYMVATASNVAEHKCHDRVRRGFVNDMLSMAGFLRWFRDYHNLPGCKHTFKTSLIG